MSPSSIPAVPVGHTTLSAVEMPVAQRSPCLGGGERKTFPYFVGLLGCELACGKQGLSGRSPGGRGAREGAEDTGCGGQECGAEAVLLQEHCTTEQLWTGRASKPVRTQE